MKAVERFPTWLCVTVFLGVLSFMLADDRMGLLALAVPVVGVAWASARFGKPVALPRLIVSMLVLLAIVNACLNIILVGNEPIVSVLGVFLVYIQLIKILDRRTARDDAQALTLSLFVAIASVLTGNSLALGLVLAPYAPLAIATAMLLQVRTGLLEQAERERTVQAASGAGVRDVPFSARAPGVSERVDRPLRTARSLTPGARSSEANRQLLRQIGFSATTCLVLAALVFVLAPRGLASDFLGQFGTVHETSIGFSDQLQLGASGFLQDNPTPMFDLEITNEAGENMGGLGKSFYLRGAVRDHYDPKTYAWTELALHHLHEVRRRGFGDFLAHGEGPLTPGGSWTAVPLAVSADVERSIARGRRSLRRGSDGGDEIAQAKNYLLEHFIMRSGVERHSYLFSVWRPISILSNRRMQLYGSPEDRTLHVGSVPNGQLEYTIKSVPPDMFVSDDADEPMPPAVPPETFAGPVRELTQRVLASAHLSMQGDSPPMNACAIAIRQYLRTRYTYTTEMVAPKPDQDPIEMFLFDTKRGHCEYFASAMAAMCQSVGIRARVVLGYLANEYNPISGQYVVRQSSAHAWTEVYVGRGRWLVFDASPPGDIERLHQPPHGVLASLRGWWDAMESSWATTIVGYEGTAKVRLFGRSGTRNWQRVDAVADRMASWIKTRRAEGRSVLLPIVLPVACLAALAFALVRAWPALVKLVRDRERKGRRQSPELAARNVSFYDKALRELDRAKRRGVAGVSKPAHAPPLAHARLLSRRDAALGRAFATIADLYYRARFGQVFLTLEENSQGEHALAELRARLAALLGDRAK